LGEYVALTGGSTAFGLQLRKDFQLIRLPRLSLPRVRCQPFPSLLVSIIAFQIVQGLCHKNPKKSIAFLPAGRRVQPLKPPARPAIVLPGCHFTTYDDHITDHLLCIISSFQKCNLCFMFTGFFLLPPQDNFNF